MTVFAIGMNDNVKVRMRLSFSWPDLLKSCQGLPLVSFSFTHLTDIIVAWPFYGEAELKTDETIKNSTM